MASCQFFSNARMLLAVLLVVVGVVKVLEDALRRAMSCFSVWVRSSGVAISECRVSW